MKRILVLTCAVAFCAAFAAAQPQKGNPEGRPFGEAKITETKRAEFEKARKEMLESRKELNDLGKKYRKETDPAKKTGLENKIREKAAADYDKNIADMKARSANAKERLGDMDKKLGDAQKPEVRQERINKIVESVKEGKGGRGNKSGGKKGWGKETKKPAKDKNKDTK